MTKNIQLSGQLTSESKEYSPTSNIMELKKVEDNLATAKNRVALLKYQLKKEQQSIKKNQNKIEEVINKKIAVSQLNHFKNRDNTEELERLQEKRRRNKSMRLEHEKSLQDIQKAVYLVKLDDARQIKKINEEHRRKMKELEEQGISNKMKKEAIKEQTERAKEKKKQYWKEKLVSIYANQAEQSLKINKDKMQKIKQLKMLEEEEMALLDDLSKKQSKQLQTKKEYVAAMSLPAKDVAEAVEQSQSSIHIQRKKPDILRKRSQVNQSMQIRRKDDIKIPHHANLNPIKLKIILTELKKLEKEKQEPAMVEMNDQ